MSLLTKLAKGTNFIRQQVSSAAMHSAANPKWMDDADSATCLVCDTPFNMRVRRHHCRVCFRLVCASCSSRTMDLEVDGRKTPQRVCDECYVKLEAAKGIFVSAGDEIDGEDLENQVLIKVLVSGAKQLAPPTENASLLHLGSNSEVTRARAPYVLFYVGDQLISHTSPLPNTLAPHWDSFFQFRISVSSPYSRYLVAEVRDKNRGKMNNEDVIGRCRIPLFEIQPGAEVTRWYPLVTQDGMVAGKLHLLVQRGIGGEASEESALFRATIPTAQDMRTTFTEQERAGFEAALIRVFPPGHPIFDRIFLRLSDDPTHVIPCRERLLQVVEYTHLFLKPTNAKGRALIGTLLLTSHRLLWLPNNVAILASSIHFPIQIPLACVAHVLVKRHWRERYNAIEVSRKDFITYVFALPRNADDDRVSAAGTTTTTAPTTADASTAEAGDPREPVQASSTAALATTSPAAGRNSSTANAARTRDDGAGTRGGRGASREDDTGSAPQHRVARALSPIRGLRNANLRNLPARLGNQVANLASATRRLAPGGDTGSDGGGPHDDEYTEYTTSKAGGDGLFDQHVMGAGVMHLPEETGSDDGRDGPQDEPRGFGGASAGGTGGGSGGSGSGGSGVGGASGTEAGGTDTDGVADVNVIVDTEQLEAFRAIKEEIEWRQAENAFASRDGLQLGLHSNDGDVDDDSNASDAEDDDSDVESGPESMGSTPSSRAAFRGNAGSIATLERVDDDVHEDGDEAGDVGAQTATSTALYQDDTAVGPLSAIAPPSLASEPEQTKTTAPRTPLPPTPPRAARASSSGSENGGGVPTSPAFGGSEQQQESRASSITTANSVASTNSGNDANQNAGTCATPPPGGRGSRTSSIFRRASSSDEPTTTPAEPSSGTLVRKPTTKPALLHSKSAKGATFVRTGRPATDVSASDSASASHDQPGGGGLSGAVTGARKVRVRGRSVLQSRPTAPRHQRSQRRRQVLTMRTIEVAEAARTKFDVDLEEEWRRQGLTAQPGWRVSKRNRLYTFCTSYPRRLAVPSALNDSFLQDAGKCRSRARIPVATWLHPQTKAALCRSSQPMAGIANTALPKDERLLMEIRATAIDANLSVVVDCMDASGRDTPASSSCSSSSSAGAAGALHTASTLERQAHGRVGNGRTTTAVASPRGAAACATGGRKSTRPSDSSSRNTTSSEGSLSIEGTTAGAPSEDSAGKSNISAQSVKRNISNADDNDLVEVVVPSGTMRRNRRHRLRVTDCRPIINAKGNQLMGKGHENIARLGGPDCATLRFLSIPNIHVVRESFAATREACVLQMSTDVWFAKLQETKWLAFLSSILRGSVAVARYLHSGDPVLVHCSDGWDRTTQVACLAQLLLDPYYRTIDGFRVLIQKDWCAFGHQFRLRTSRDTEWSPIFLQFLDATWQVWRQYPWEFEFNANLLHCLATMHWTRYFGNFLFNNEFERHREVSKPDELLESIWDYIDYNRPLFVNCVSQHHLAATGVFEELPQLHVAEEQAAVTTAPSDAGPSAGSLGVDGAQESQASGGQDADVATAQEPAHATQAAQAAHISEHDAPPDFPETSDNGSLLSGVGVTPVARQGTMSDEQRRAEGLELQMQQNPDAYRHSEMFGGSGTRPWMRSAEQLQLPGRAGVRSVSGSPSFRQLSGQTHISPPNRLRSSSGRYATTSTGGRTGWGSMQPRMSMQMGLAGLGATPPSATGSASFPTRYSLSISGGSGGADPVSGAAVGMGTPLLHHSGMAGAASSGMDVPVSTMQDERGSIVAFSSMGDLFGGQIDEDDEEEDLLVDAVDAEDAAAATATSIVSGAAAAAAAVVRASPSLSPSPSATPARGGAAAAVDIAAEGEESREDGAMAVSAVVQEEEECPDNERCSDSWSDSEPSPVTGTIGNSSPGERPTGNGNGSVSALSHCRSHSNNNDDWEAVEQPRESVSFSIVEDSRDEAADDEDEDEDAVGCEDEEDDVEVEVEMESEPVTPATPIKLASEREQHPLPQSPQPACPGTVRLIIPSPAVHHLALWEDVFFDGIPHMRSSWGSAVREQLLEGVVREQQFVIEELRQQLLMVMSMSTGTPPAAPSVHASASE